MGTPARALSINRRKHFLHALRKHKLHLLMFLPVLLHYAVFRYGPIYGITLAFKDYRILKGIMGSPWVGLANFQRLFASLDFWPVFRNTLMISFYNFAFGFPAPILLAVLLNELRSMKFKRVAQTISYLPHFISWVILAGIFMEILSPSRGPINGILRAMGLPGVYFLGEPRWFRSVLVVTSIWKGIGWGSIVYLSALSGVNEELYDAARVDGAGRWRRIWHVTLPAILPVVVIMLILAAGKLVDDNFDQIFNLINAAVYNVGDVMETYIYRQGIGNLDYSYATAVELFRNAIALCLVLMTNFAAKRLGEYGLW